MTKYVGLIGYPLGHSVSPAMQQAAFDYLELDLRYEAWETESSALALAVERLRQPSVLGANVTVPHKETIIPLLDELDGSARQAKAVNTVANRHSRLGGYNSDGNGFVTALRQRGGFDPRGKRVLVLGAGGASRGVCFALCAAGVSRLRIVNRTLQRTEALAADLRHAGVDVFTLPWQTDHLTRAVSDCDLLVNCTSMGMRHSPDKGKSPLPASVIPSRTLICDVVYNPLETALLSEARKAGARTLGGLAMLVYQGAAAFELWTGQQAPIDIMYSAAERAVRGA